MSEDNKIVEFDVQKYIDALDGLIGADHAYFSGDPQIELILEVIRIAKEYETIINELYSKNQSLKIENTLLQKQALAENKTTATAIRAEHQQQQRTAEYIKRLKEENERLQQLIDDMQQANIVSQNFPPVKAEKYRV